MLNRFKLFLCAGLLSVLAGCGQQPAKNLTGDPRASTAEDNETESSLADDHAHQPGAHGGNIVAIGKDAFHAEAVFGERGDLRLYTLGQDETKVLEVNK